MELAQSSVTAEHGDPSDGYDAWLADISKLTQVTAEQGDGFVVLREPTETRPGVVALEGAVTFHNPPHNRFGVEHDVRVVLAVEDGGRHVVEEVALLRRPGGPPVTVRAMQRASLGYFVREARSKMSSSAVLVPGGGWIFGALGPGHRVRVTGTDFVHETQAGDPDVLDAAIPGRRRGGRRPGRTTHQLRAVGRVHRAALEAGERAPVRVVAELGEELGIIGRGPRAEAGARKWIESARKAGFIPPAKSTRPSLADYDGWVLG